MKDADREELHSRFREVIKIIQDDVHVNNILTFDKSIMVQVSKKIDEVKSTIKSVNDDSILFDFRKFIYDIYNNDTCDTSTSKSKQMSVDRITSILLSKKNYSVFNGTQKNKPFYDKIHKEQSFMIINKEILFLLMNSSVNKSFVDVLMQILMNIVGYKRSSYFYKMDKMIDDTGYSRKMIINVLKELLSMNIIALTNNNQYGEGIITLNPDFYEHPSKYIKRIGDRDEERCL
jgi:hypothetical protein